MRQFVVGDLHGAHKALLQCFERSGFDYEKDELIMLGDICDGWPEVRQCVDELLKVKNLILILGNHDQWTIDWANGDNPGRIWTQQGGLNTLKSYGAELDLDPAHFPKKHLAFFKKANYWFLDEADRLFVHGGISPALKLEETPVDIFLWDRSLVRMAIQEHALNRLAKITCFSEVFVGHTSTTHLSAPTKRGIISELSANEEWMKPINACEVWALDTGAGWEGKLTIMEINTKKYWQSDLVESLYPGIRGRK